MRVLLAALFLLALATTIFLWPNAEERRLLGTWYVVTESAEHIAIARFHVGGLLDGENGGVEFEQYWSVTGDRLQITVPTAPPAGPAWWHKLLPLQLRPGDRVPHELTLHWDSDTVVRYRHRKRAGRGVFYRDPEDAAAEVRRQSTEGANAREW